MPTLCNFENCIKRAVYAYHYGKPLRCKKHTEDHMKGQYKICHCGLSQPSFNYPELKAKYCKTCSTKDMVDVRSNKCLTCKVKRPSYNLPRETTALYCKTCALDGMIDIKNKKCLTCKVICPSYNLPGETMRLYCKTCALEGMVDIKNKKCVTCNKTQPLFNLSGETKALYCKKCALDGMVDVISKKCLTCKEKSPSYNLPGETTAIYCKECALEGMVNVHNKKCLTCHKIQPNYNLPGETKPLYCKTCALDGMIDITHPRCKAPNCPQRGNKKYRGYCTYCFSHMFPKDPLTFQIQFKTKEIAVRDFINSNFEGFTHDKPLYTGHCDCTIRRRVDHRIIINNTLLAIETDENQHKSYDDMDEDTRYNDLYMAFSGKWIYIRFNPDKYKGKNGKTKNPEIATRLRVLKTEIEKHMTRIDKEQNKELVERVYLYYDE